ncbi:MAG: ThuA domain-containing protein, partial [Clostridiales bacterium]|nr:ThuA domain-containing protein [Clostridiales bacterium]
MNKKALIIWGGWSEHQPEQVAKKLEGMLLDNGFDVNVSNDLNVLLNEDYLKSQDLIVPCITNHEITPQQLNPLLEAVASGVGLAGAHGGLGDSFRKEFFYQFMVGGQWVAHPGNDGVTYTVNVKKNTSSPIIDNIDDFEVCSEQYYLHVDPVVNVLMTTKFPVVNGYHGTNGAVDMPVMWTKMWGYGRVFYS